MENLSKTIAEVKSALDQATQMLDENQSLKEEIHRLKSNPNTNSAEREQRLVISGYEQGRDSVLNQLSDHDFETEVDIDEQLEENGFEVRFYKSVDTSIRVNDVLEELYDEYSEESIEEVAREIINQVNEEN